MHQHYRPTSEDDSRSKYYWGNLREHQRRKARKEIRDRVVSSMITSSSASVVGNGSSEGAHDALHVVREERKIQQLSKDAVTSLLFRVVKEDCSFFSLQTMQERQAILELPIDAKFLLADGCGEGETKNDDKDEDPRKQMKSQLVAHEQFVSWLGPEDGDKYREFVSYVKTLRSFTLMEFAIWIRRYRIVGALLLGGINPCVRGRHVTSNTPPTSNKALAILQSVGSTAVVPRFFNAVPLSLSTYIVKRVVDMRRLSHHATQISRNGANDSTTFSCFDCPLCRNHQLPTCIRLVFTTSCSHSLCEPCFWKDLVEKLEERFGDVVVCPVCEAATGAKMCDQRNGYNVKSFSPQLSPLERRHQSLARFQALPTNAAELKALETTKRKRKLRAPIASTWFDAIKDSLGLTKDVRRDRFWLNVERRSFHYVRTSLELGVNVLETNQYGQTPLFLAAYMGDERLVRLLLDYYSPEDIVATSTANGGLTVLGAVRASHHDSIVRILLDHGAPDDNDDSSNYLAESNNRSLSSLLRLVGSANDCSPKMTTLIDTGVDHPGAGSYLIDDCLSLRSVEILCHLWTILPMDVAVKKKETPCSTRRYFCDAEKQISSALSVGLEPFFPAKDCAILPHMRFLCYSEPGTLLPPHVDLPRVDPFTNVRSTHTLLLYLTDCRVGGATNLLGGMSGSERDVKLARVQPKRARLFLFPHGCPHEGETVVDVPKILIRGEAKLPVQPR